tara:strand:- start:46 stop:357 length:312 start_codon:yes stop_codon:yes gene_type:complete
VITTAPNVSNLVIAFMRRYPRLLKRAVIWGFDFPHPLDKFMVTAWAYHNIDLIKNLWDGFDQKLPPIQFVPNLPHEGCEIQETWNVVWDKSIPTATRGLRIYY